MPYRALMYCESFHLAWQSKLPFNTSNLETTTFLAFLQDFLIDHSNLKSGTKAIRARMPKNEYMRTCPGNDEGFDFRSWSPEGRVQMTSGKILSYPITIIIYFSPPNYFGTCSFCSFLSLGY